MRRKFFCSCEKILFIIVRNFFRSCEKIFFIVGRKRPVYVYEKNSFYKSVSKVYLCLWEIFFLTKVSQRAAIDFIIFPCPYWYNAYVFILILFFMMGKKLERIEKTGVNFLGEFGGKGKSVSQRAPKRTTLCIDLNLIKIS